MTGEIDPLFANHPEVDNLKRAFAENDIPGPFREPTEEEVSVAILEFNRGTQAEGAHNGAPAMRRALRAALNVPWKPGDPRCHECDNGVRPEWLCCPYCGTAQSSNDAEFGTKP